MTTVNSVGAQAQQTQQIKIEIAGKKGENKYTSVWQGLKANGYNEQEISKIDKKLHELDNSYDSRKIKDGSVIDVTNAIKAAGFGDRLEREVQVEAGNTNTNANANGNAPAEPQDETPSQAATPTPETSTLTAKEQVDKAENVLNLFKECDGTKKYTPGGDQNNKVSKQELYRRTATDGERKFLERNIDDLAKQNEFLINTIKIKMEN